MPQDGKKTGIIIGLGALGVGLALAIGKGKAAPPGNAILHGLVTDMVTTEPIPGVKVYLDGAITHTNNEGMYRFPGVAPGEYDLAFEKEGYETVGF